MSLSEKGSIDNDKRPTLTKNRQQTPNTINPKGLSQKLLQKSPGTSSPAAAAKFPPLRFNAGIAVYDLSLYSLL